MKTFLKYRWRVTGILAVMAVWYYFCLPSRLFQEPYSTVLQGRTGELLGATIAADGQWRFPMADSVPEKFGQAIVAFEDKRFWSHPGVDILSLGRAFEQNIKAGAVVRGGSTLSMQVIRLSRGNQRRTMLEKIIEIVMATRLELRYSKHEILGMYAAHAPFGGNVVGLEAACWRYFGIDARNLSWGEASLLAVLPNAPALIHPGRNRAILKAKRDRLLVKLRDRGIIDALTCELAQAEQIPEEPVPLPQHAPHLLDRMAKEGKAQTRLRSTVDMPLQLRLNQVLSDHQGQLKANQVFNAAAVVVEVASGNVLAYAGNIRAGREHGESVDVVNAPRSTGSILKPILYAAMLDAGKILPATLLPDVPTVISGFSPKNFSRQYDGAVPADKALIRSLNIPAVHLLRDYHYGKFYNLLQDVGMTTLSRQPDEYGLSLILGGAEGKLYEITGIYASMARTLNNYFQHPGKNRYSPGDFHAPVYGASTRDSVGRLTDRSWLSAASIFVTFETLKELYRPGEETGWRHFSSTQDIAWKTGTSFGFRDGWAVGVTPQYAVGVWVGNADGEGRPGLTGTDAAAPILFDIFSSLPASPWFHKPVGELRPVATCSASGYRVSERCDKADTLLVPRAGMNTPPCPHHQAVHLSVDLRYRVHSDCADVHAMHHTNWFVLPPVQEFYFKSKNASYRSLPPFRKDCAGSFETEAMAMIYPRPDSKIFIPRDFDGRPGSSVFHLAHRDPNAAVYWHLDGAYLGSTKKSHHLAINPGEGKHVLVLIDETGHALERRFEVISKM